MKYSLPVAFAASMILGVGVAPAAAQGKAPIAVSSCSLVVQPNGASSAARAYVTFTNNGKAAATSVTFHVATSGGVVRDIAETGSFAPGAKVKKELANVPVTSTVADQKLTCTPVKVAFSDGTSWAAASHM